MLGSTDKTMGQLSLAWKAIHIGLPMLVTGGIAPGNIGDKGIAWKALPWSFHYVASYK